MADEKLDIGVLLRKHNLLTRAIPLIGLGILVFFAVTLPLFTRAQSTQADLASKRAKADNLTNQVVFLNNIDPEVLKTRLQVLDMALPPSKDVLIYLATIDGLSRELDLSLKGVQLSPGELSTGSAKTKQSEKADSVRALETQLTIAGTYDSILKFLNVIEDTAPLMRVKNVKVSKTSGDSYNLSVILSMAYATVGDINKSTGKSVLFDETEEKLMGELLKLKSYKMDVTSTDSASVTVGKNDLFAP